MLRLAAPILGVCLAVCAAPSSASSPQATKSWLAYGHDAQLTNYVHVSGLTPATAHRLRQAWVKRLDGPIVASPLYASGGQGGLANGRSTVFAATEAGSLYALNPRTGSVFWKRTF